MKKLIINKWVTFTLILVLTSVTAQIQRPLCKDSEWQCDDGSCIKLKLKCDTDPDCPDGSDEFESTCTPPTPAPLKQESLCGKNQFQCDDGTCIKAKLMCDTDPDCPDESDENPVLCEGTQAPVVTTTTTTTTTTPKPACPPNQFQCGTNGPCLKNKLRCDEDVDCPNGEDEDPAFCASNLITEAPVLQQRIVHSQAEADDTDTEEIEATESPEETSEFPLGTRTDQDDEVIRESLRIIQAGDEHIDDDERYRDVVLMAGMSGSGKTTITKFITGDNTDMESYWSGQRFIIRDKEGRISSGKSTVVSKSIFPKMVVNTKTNMAFFDLPGFGDTRGPAVELANGVFIKRVADKARRVKIILVVNFSSLRSGEIRTDFKNLLEHLTLFIKSPSKYNSAIALIANKVDLDVPTSTIIPSVAKFLQNARESLDKIFEDELIRENARSIIDALLVRKGKFYIRLGFMRQPDQSGILSEIPAFQSTKTALTKLCTDSTRFIAKSADDFGISVTPSTKLFVRNAVGHLYANMGYLTQELSEEIRKYFMDKFGLASNVYHLIRDFRETLTFLQNRTLAISTVISSNQNQIQQSPRSRSELLDLLQDISYSIDLKDPDHILAENMGRNLEHLDFLEPLLTDENKAEANQISERVIDSWTSPIKETLNDVENTIYTIAKAVNNVVAASMALTGSELQNLYTNQIEIMYDINSQNSQRTTKGNQGEEDEEEQDQVEQFLKDMKTDSKFLENLVTKLLNSKSINQFFNESCRGIEQLTVVVAPSNLLHMLTLPLPEGSDNNYGQGKSINQQQQEEDFSLADLPTKPSPYMPALWVSPFEELQAFLDEAAQTMIATRKDSKMDDAQELLRELLETKQGEYEKKRELFKEEIQKAEKALAAVQRDVDGIVLMEQEIVDDTAAGQMAEPELVDDDDDDNEGQQKQINENL